MEAKSVAEQLFFTTVRIEATNEQGKKSVGTGFFFSYEKDGTVREFIITNKHVVMGTTDGKFHFITTRDGEKTPNLEKGGFILNMGNWSHLWFGHPEDDIDIAICELGQVKQASKKLYQQDFFCCSVRNSIIPSNDQLKELDALEDVTFIGYPDGLWDTTNFLPIARKGMTASPINVDFEGRPQFLIDASVFGGSSGSPVFIFDKGMHAKKDGSISGQRIFFIGVVAAVFQRLDSDGIISVPIPTKNKSISLPFQYEKIDIGIVFKARTVIETIESYLSSK